MKRSGLRDRMGRLFAVQLTVIGIATLIGIYVTQLIIEDLLTRQALELEAEHFWNRYAQDPSHPLPDVANMRGFMVSLGTDHRATGVLPDGLGQLEPGFRRATVAGRSLLVHVSDRNGQRLYLLFDVNRVSDLAFFLGVVPLSIVLLLMYLTLFVIYRWSQRALSPIVRLARKLADVDFNQAGRIDLDLSSLAKDADLEVLAMIEALEHFTARLDAAIERERIFTRDAGHELRTPVAVFKGSLDLLEQDRDRPEHERKALARMRRTVDDMESLLQTLLLLAREDAVEMPVAETLANEVVARQLEALRPLAERSGNTVSVDAQAELKLRVPANVLEIALGNLIRNALTYTNGGQITITITAHSVRVADTGIGMSPAQLDQAFEPFYRAEESRSSVGHGLGLAIVNRLATQFGWKISAASQLAAGTTIELAFT